MTNEKVYQYERDDYESDDVLRVPVYIVNSSQQHDQLDRRFGITFIEFAEIEVPR